MIAPQTPNEQVLQRLRDRNRAVGRRDNPHQEEIVAEELTGAIKWFDATKGYGFIRCDNGQDVLLHIVCLRASGFHGAEEGSPVRFQAIHRPTGWQAFRILSLGAGPVQERG
jgi:cold shock protein